MIVDQNDKVTISLEKYEEMKSEIERLKKAYDEKPQTIIQERWLTSVAKAVLFITAIIFLIMFLCQNGAFDL